MRIWVVYRLPATMHEGSLRHAVPSFWRVTSFQAIPSMISISNHLEKTTERRIPASLNAFSPRSYDTVNVGSKAAKQVLFPFSTNISRLNPRLGRPSPIPIMAWLHKCTTKLQLLDC